MYHLDQALTMFRANYRECKIYFKVCGVRDKNIITWSFLS